jgi:hypothetical protein
MLMAQRSSDRAGKEESWSMAHQGQRVWDGTAQVS